jgi:hypothetical protein
MGLSSDPDLTLLLIKELKVWWQDATLLVYFSYFITYIRSHYIYPSPHRLQAQWEKPPCGAESRIELEPALQHADVLPTELRRTKIKELKDGQKMYILYHIRRCSSTEFLR